MATLALLYLAHCPVCRMITRLAILELLKAWKETELEELYKIGAQARTVCRYTQSSKLQVLSSRAK